MSDAPFYLAMIAAVLTSASAALGQTPDDARRQSLAVYQQSVAPLLARYCAECHGATKQEGNVRLDRLNPDMAAGDDGETWHDTLNKLNLGQMPPEDAPQLKPEDREALIDWLTGELKRATAVRRGTGGRVVIRRLTRYEYANTLRDLLGVDIDFAEELPAEPSSPDGLKNNGLSLGMSPQQIEAYIEIARLAIAKTIVVGDKPEVFSYHQRQITDGRGPLYPPNVGAALLPDYPMEGEFLIRVEASVTGAPEADSAIMRVVMGVRPSPKNLKTKDISVVKVTGDEEHPQLFEFRGRMENFPLHDPQTAYRERRYPGLQIGFWNETFNQSPGPSRPTRRKASAREPEPTSKAPAGPVLRIHTVSFEAPFFESWPPPHHTRILFPSELVQTDEREYARQVLERFMGRAFRRPVTSEEVARKLAVYDQYRPQLPSLAATMREVLPEILVSHDFLYLAEPTDGLAKQPLNDYEIAARLSYFLWSTMPDDRLFSLASAGELRDAQVRSAEVRQMLRDSRSWNFVENFTDQWLNLSALGRVAVNPDFYPDFDERLKEDMRRETQHFFAEILHQGLSAINLIDSDFAMLNRPLAEHYGIAGPQDHQFVRVTLKPEDHRGGLLGQGSILLGNSSGDDSHPIYRGVWIRDRLLGDPPASPPPDVPELKKDTPELASLSLRQQLEVHRQKEACNSCHRHIDPWGLALENFDAVGLWRTEVRKPSGKGTPAKFTNGVLVQKAVPPKFTSLPVESTATLPSGEPLRGPEGLKAHLIQHEKQRFAQALVRRLLAYSLGRSLELVDEPTVESLTASFERSGYQIGELLVAITQSEPFLTK